MRPHPTLLAVLLATLLPVFLSALLLPMPASSQGPGIAPGPGTDGDPASSAPATFAPAIAAPADFEPVSFDPDLFEDLSYRMVGPSRGGRVTAVEGVRGSPGLFYMGSTGGGVWKTTDHGQTWHNISDGYFATPSIGAIQVADSDPDRIYVGTGSDGIRSNVITGRGVYRSDDAGETWRFVGLPEAGQIGAVEVHPDDPNRVYVAAIGHPFGANPERGVFRSTDGGESWERVLFLSDSTGAVDLELHPTDPAVIYAGMWRGERKPWTIVSGAREGGVWRSDDGGDTWRRLGGGLPDGLIGKIDLGVSAADPDRIYALVEAPEPEEGLYRSDDRGETWRHVNGEDRQMTRPFYFTNLTVDPTDADRLYVGNVGWYVSEDGGESFERRPTAHVDNHGMWIDPDDPETFIQGNDGGAAVTLNGGRTWSTQLNQPTAELYQVQVDDGFPYWIYGAQQDNSTLMLPSLPPSSSPPDHPAASWRAVAGCETGPVEPSRIDPNVIYGNCKGRFSRYSLLSGQEQQYWVEGAYMYGHAPRDLELRFQRVSPIEISPHDPAVVYHASQYVHRTTDEGVTWERISPDLTANDPRYQGISGEPITRDITGEEFYSTLYALEESPLEPGVIWAGANDGPVHVTRDGGASWTEVTPSGLPWGARINAVEPSVHRPGKAYVTAYRYLLDDWEPYVFRTTDYGESWTRITTGRNGIAIDEPARVVREDPAREGLLYAGTEFGMHVSFDDGGRWHRLQQNLPVTPVTDIEVHRGDLVLSTMGRSFWILDGLGPLREWSPDVASTPVHFFTPWDAVRMRYRTFRSTPSDPEYPEPGARFDYWLAEEVEGPLLLEIFGPDGHLLRRFSSEAPGEDTTPVLTLRGEVAAETGTPALPDGRGMHRFVWDLRHRGAWTEDARSSGRRGPLAVPGEYRARLITEGRVSEHRFRIVMDPRVAESGVTQADLEEQLALNLLLRDDLSAARRLAHRIDGRLEAEPDGVAAASLRDLRARLVTADGSYRQPMLIDQLEYLWGMTTRADQRPGADARVRRNVLHEALERIVDEFEGLGR